MICPNCGFQNAPGDEFCGSCGQFLAWTGAAGGPAGEQVHSEASPSAPVDGPPPSTPPPAAFPVAPPPPVAQPSGEPTVVLPAVPPPGAPAQAVAPPVGAAWSENLRRCDVCGTANELSRTFCLNCGARLGRSGTTTGATLAVGAADDERRRGTRLVALAIGGALLFVLAIAVGFVAFGGLAPAAPPHTTAPPASLIAAGPGSSVASPASLPAPSVPAGSGQPLVTLPPSVDPGSTNPPAPTPGVTQPPPSGPAVTAPPPGGFVCDASTFSAAQPGGWKITQATWTRKLTGDVLSLALQPSSSAAAASVDATILSPDQVEPTYGVPGPSSGDVAVVLAFNDAVTSVGSFGSQVGFRTLQEFQVYRHGGRVFVVIGANGQGCYGLASDAWTSGSSGAPQLAVALQH